MPLSPAQYQALNADIAANANTVTWNGTPTAISALPNDPDANQVIADWYNQTVATPYWVIRTDAPMADILNAVTWPNFTPAVTITTSTTAQAAQQATAASQLCQGKQFNLQLLTAGRTTFDATKATQTAGLKDATTQLPSGASFGVQAAGWVNITQVLQRQCRNVERLYVTANGAVTALKNAASARGTLFDGTTGNPDVLAFEGTISGNDVLTARNSQ